MSWRAGGESAEGILVEGSSSKAGGHTACLCAVRDSPIGGRKQAAGRPRIPLNMEPLPGEPQGDDAEKWEEVEGNSRADCTCGPGARGRGSAGPGRWPGAPAGGWQGQQVCRRGWEDKPGVRPWQ